MTSTFLGKWRLSFQWSCEYNHYVVYRHALAQGISAICLCTTGSPLRETNIAFIRTL